MGGNLGYNWESEIERFVLGITGELRTAPLHSRSRRQPGSGSMDSAKGDVVTASPIFSRFGQFYFECKDRKSGRGDGKSLSVTKAELDKAREEAESQLMHPIVAVKMKQTHGGSRAPLFPGDAVNSMNTKWVMMPLGTFGLMLEYLRDLEMEHIETKEVPVKVAQSSGACRACRKALDKHVEAVRRVMGG